MAAANFSGTKAEIEEYEQVRRMEERHVRVAPEGEREEISRSSRPRGSRARRWKSSSTSSPRRRTAGSKP
jgi:hypothetical protein